MSFARFVVVLSLLMVLGCSGDESGAKLVAEDVRAHESEGKATIVLTRSGDASELSKEASIKLSTVAGTAVAAEDYEELLDYEVVFAPEQTEATAEITLIDDEVFERAQYFTVKLSGAKALKPDRNEIHVRVSKTEEVLKLSDFNAELGVRFVGSALDVRAGREVSSAGDVNGDGQPDFMIASTEGVHVVFGPSVDEPFESDFNLGALDGSNGFTIKHSTEQIGDTLSVADVNGDGLDDLLIGAPQADIGDKISAGAVYVVFGQAEATAFQAELVLGESNTFEVLSIEGDVANSETGRSLAHGDVNGDGVEDIFIGAPGPNNTSNDVVGRAYVVFGSSELDTMGTLTLGELDGSNGVSLEGEQISDFFGNALASGDFNSDGQDDLVIGMPSVDVDGFSNAGKVFIVYGSNDFATLHLTKLAEMNDNQGSIVVGGAEFDSIGANLANVGDLNGDGRDDLFVSRSGEAVVIYGHAIENPFSLTWSLNDLAAEDGVRWLREDLYGLDASGIDDVNEDGIPDMLIGSFLLNGTGAVPIQDSSHTGGGFVIYGRTSDNPFAASNDISDLDPRDGFRFIGTAVRDFAGQSVTGLADANGDDTPELIIGSPQFSGSGFTYLMWGGY